LPAFLLAVASSSWEKAKVESVGFTCGERCCGVEFISPTGSVKPLHQIGLLPKNADRGGPLAICGKIFIAYRRATSGFEDVE
jgi:hypothetical protein